MKHCKICAADISDRYGWSQFCLDCARERRLTKKRAYNNERYKRVFAKGVLTCIDCGGGAALDKNKSRDLVLCTYCSNARRKVWTREAVIAAIQEFASLYGRPPGALDWNISMARANGRQDLIDRWEDDACWPGTNSVYGPFGVFPSWNEAIRAAGFEPRKIGGRGPMSDYARANRVVTRTHCKHGHEFSAENTRNYRGGRICRKCEAKRKTRWIARRKAVSA